MSLLDRACSERRDLNTRPASAPIHVTVKTSARRYFESLKKEEVVYLLWDVDGVPTKSGWTAFAYPGDQFKIRSRVPFVTRLCGKKVVISDADRIADLNGKVLTYERGRLQLT